MKLTRRNFLGAVGAGTAAAAMPFDLWLEKHAHAQGVMTRYSTASAEGKEMLKIYAIAVKIMKGRWAGHPHSWTFQWYTHWVNGNTNKTAALNAVYGNRPPIERSLAEEMWDTCQGHGPNPVKYFLAWHRMFVFYFEQIIRTTTGINHFTLPYWPYDETDKRVIPTEFRNGSSSAYGSLYVGNRNSGINEGQSIERYGALDFKCMTEKSFLEPGGGFNGKLNQNPHGQVHVDVGTSTNMGQIPYAANDPVFWTHHCQVDRLWQSWNAAGGKNPDDDNFKNQKFIFDDGNGMRVVAKISDFLNISTLNYKYDTLMDIPPIESPMLVASSEKAPAFVAGAMKAAEKHGPATNMLAAEIPGAITLGAAPVRIPVNPNAEMVAPMEMLSKAAPASQNIYLILKDVYTADSPGVAYGVYLNLPEGAAPDPSGEYYIGSINFFNATSMPGMKAMFMTDSFTFNITDKVKDLDTKQQLSDGINVTLSPFNTPDAKSSPKIGRIEIIVE